jgi:hypothetical protein
MWKPRGGEEFTRGGGVENLGSHGGVAGGAGGREARGGLLAAPEPPPGNDIAVAGTGEAGFNGDGAATEAQINNPRDMTFGPDGRLYFADEMNHRVRALDVETLFLETVAGTGQAGLDGDGGKAAEALFAGPAGVSFDQEGALYVTDTLNHRIRKVGMSQ